MAVAALLAPVGCSIGGDEEPQRASGAPAAVAEVVERLERATAESDFATVCADVFTAAARERAGGVDCERLLRSAAEGIERPRIEVRSIDVTGDRARVKVDARAAGEAVVGESLELRKLGGEWRVEALGG